MGVSAETSIDTSLHCIFRNYLSTASCDDNLISDTLFDRQIVDSLHVLVVNVVMRDDGGSQDCICIQFDCSVNQLFYRYGSTQVVYLDTPLFDTAVLDVDDFTQAYGVVQVEFPEW